MNGPLRFPDEFGRHKALDLIGDLALAGLPLLARVEAHKAGHALHTQLVTRLLSDPSLWTVSTEQANHPEVKSSFAQLSPVPAAIRHSLLARHPFVAKTGALPHNGGNHDKP